MEPIEKVWARTKEFVEDKIKNSKQQNILVVSHNVIASFVEYILLNKEVDIHDPNQAHNFKNAEIKCVKI